MPLLELFKETSKKLVTELNIVFYNVFNNSTSEIDEVNNYNNKKR